MILNGILIEQRRSCTITHYQTVCGCTVVVGGREALIVKSSCTACCNDNGLCLCNKDFLCFHIHEDCARSLAVFVLDKFNSCCVVNNGDSEIPNLVTKNTHDLCA